MPEQKDVARCLICGDLGHLKEGCPHVECRKCHAHGHTGSVCTTAKLPPIKFDNHIVADKTPELRGDIEDGTEHVENFYAS